ncbi:hemolysin family protein [Holzapfeliella floricola]|uniref:Hemolysin n=1 Tax=Holzapfeliella floricola DSM 23037 = JCM 16512 TaxID=1423744 RepID=A0A0R2DK55_9LACO|nr:hemolysin family protein [Holzapfeliella floricola]KRN04496.1 hemolysin [Holzapfeliella floricola DSM 23037 = JCM 16512]
MSGDPGSFSSLLIQLALIVVLTIINAFFAAAEMAIVSVNRNKMETEAEEGSRSAKKILVVMNESTDYLATIQVAITFAGFFSSATAADSLVQYIEPFFGGLSWGNNISVILITIAISYVSLVFGELFPKQIAIARPEAVCKATIGFVKVFGFVLKPFVWLISASTGLLMKVVPIDFTQKDERMSRDEMQTLIENSRKNGVIGLDEYHMLEGIISFNDKMAREVMVPRTDSFMIDIDDGTEANLDAIMKQPFSRIPVYQDDKDKIVGIIHIKTILKMAKEVGFENLKIEDAMAEPMFVPETVTIDELLLEMQKTQMQMAILLDEYGGVVGLATIEDLLEEIVGDIDDETDRQETLFTKMSDTQYVLAGKMPIYDFNEQFDTDIEANDVDTIAGYVITELGMIPSNGEHHKVLLDNGMKLTTGKVKGSRLENLTLDIPKELLEKNESDNEEDKD